MENDMQGKIALVTGGASGMGRICALRLANRGARVAIFDLNEAGLQATAAEHTNIQPFRCDISSRDDVEAQVRNVESSLGPVDHLVHAAALMPAHALADHSVEKVEFLFQVNFFGTVYMIKSLLPAMLERDSGTMILFGSIAGVALVPKMGAYCATKAAVNTYVECLQNEIRSSGVNLHLVCPPAVNTPLIDQTINTDAPGSINQAKQSGRLADPEKIIDAIDKGVAKGKDIIYPGGAWFLMIWKTLFPRLWWKTVLSFEK
jgi:NAD(P)-dependent dehydrogenase (short-subunit alcohol dehydrogenase family)